MAELIDVVGNKKNTGKRKTTEEYKNELKEIHPDVEVLGEYVNAKTDILHKCNACGNEWMSTPDKILRSKHNCPNCANKATGLALTIKEDDFINIMSDRYTLIGEYINAATNVLMKCNTCNNEWLGNPSAIMHGRGCPVCAIKNGTSKRTKTHAQFCKELENINSNIEIIGEYTTSHDHILVRCKVCSYEWSPVASSLLNGHGCPMCSGTAIYTHEEWIKKFSPYFNTNIELRSKYIDSHTKIQVHCKACGNDYEAIPYLIQTGHGCRKCSEKEHGINLTKNNETWLKELDSVNPSLEPLEDYKGANIKMSMKCKKCNYIWNIAPHTILHGGVDCPQCSCSKGEEIILSFLNSYNIEYISQKSFDGLVGTGGRLLSYDFYLPDYNMLIEYQGEQHEKPITHFGGESRFEKQQEHDKRKREYAHNHNINLLEIWYYDIDNINEILTNNLNLNTQETVIPA